MPSLRTPKSERTYREHARNRSADAECPLCSEPTLVEFTHWRILNNKFPYDLIAQTHHMLVTKRHVSDANLSVEERDELLQIKMLPAIQEYHWIIEPTFRNKTIPQHTHLHLVVGKPSDSDS